MNDKQIELLALEEYPKDYTNACEQREAYENGLKKMYSLLTKENEVKQSKVTRFEVINHANNDHNIGRVLTMYKEMEDFTNIELQYQDGGRTLKVFIS